MIQFFRAQWLWALVGLGVFTTVIWLAIVTYGNNRYNSGVKAENARWELVIAEAEQRADEAERLLREDEERRRRQNAEIVRLRMELRTEVEQEIANASDAQSRHVAYIEYRERLRQPSAERYADARADYLSTLPVDDRG